LVETVIHENGEKKVEGENGEEEIAPGGQQVDLPSEPEPIFIPNVLTAEPQPVEDTKPATDGQQVDLPSEPEPIFVPNLLTAEPQPVEDTKPAADGQQVDMPSEPEPIFILNVITAEPQPVEDTKPVEDTNPAAGAQQVDMPRPEPILIPNVITTELQPIEDIKTVIVVVEPTSPKPEPSVLEQVSLPVVVTAVEELEMNQSLMVESPIDVPLTKEDTEPVRSRSPPASPALRFPGKIPSVPTTPTQPGSRSPIRSPSRISSIRATTPTKLPSRSPSSSSSSSPSTPNNKKTDSEIMADIQASVRAREKKRLAEEAKEKAQVVRELRLAAGLSEEQVGMVQEEEVLAQVRSWRKERETSIKSVKETVKADAAKTAAYRAVSSGEEIMSELISNVQTRVARAPAVFEDPREKRQLWVDEAIRRAMVVQGATAAA
jgi:hypothetical protein